MKLHLKSPLTPSSTAPSLLVPRLAAFGVGLALLAGTAAAQTTVQEYNFPTARGSVSPPSTLRITTEGVAAPDSAVVVRDSPESLREYQRCRSVSDTAAVNNVQREAGVSQCLKELEARRQGRAP